MIELHLKSRHELVIRWPGFLGLVSSPSSSSPRQLVRTSLCWTTLFDFESLEGALHLRCLFVRIENAREASCWNVRTKRVWCAQLELKVIRGTEPRLSLADTVRPNEMGLGMKRHERTHCPVQVIEKLRYS